MTEPGISGVKVDYLNGTAPIGQLAVVCDLLSTHFGEFNEEDYGFHTYHRSRKWVGGAMVTYTPDRKEFMFSLSGDPLELISHMEVLRLIQSLAELGSKFTRLDVAFDDYERSVPLETVHQAGDSYNFTGFRKYNPHRPKSGGELEGDQAEFGRRGQNGSGKYMRIYDKFLESKGKIDCIRWELELTKDVADRVVRDYLLAVTDQTRLAHMLGSILVAFVDFVERDGETHVDRMARLGWWEEFRARLCKFEVCVTIRQPVPPLQKWAEYAKRNVMPNLAVLRIVLHSQGHDFHSVLEELLDDAEDQVDWQRQGQRKLGIDLDQLMQPLS